MQCIIRVSSRSRRCSMSCSSFAQGTDQLGGGTGTPRGSRDWRKIGARCTVSIRLLWVSSEIDTGLEAIGQLSQTAGTAAWLTQQNSKQSRPCLFLARHSNGPIALWNRPCWHYSAQTTTVDWSTHIGTHTRARRRPNPNARGTHTHTRSHSYPRSSDPGGEGPHSRSPHAAHW